VSSTLPAPHNGEESSAARSRPPEKPPFRLATGTVRSIRRRSSSLSMSLLRKFTSVHLEKGGSSSPRRSRTNCHVVAWAQDRHRTRSRNSPGTSP
jgi:hypothetical protein